jgi:hypothetical protein
MTELEYAPDNEKPLLRRLVKTILGHGNTISINDGEVDTLDYCTNQSEILKALTTTGEDYIFIHNSAKEPMGHFWLIYDNGSEGEPMIVITDYSANTYCESIWNSLDKVFG